jgi:hypothetical protein
MITCAHTDCNYTCGWTHKGGDKNKAIEPPEGDFYEIKAEFKAVVATRMDEEGSSEMKLYGCPKCHRTFIAKGESFLTE